MICTWARLLTCCLDTRPRPSIEVEVKQIVEVMTSFPLVPAKEVKTVHKGDTSGTRPLLRPFAYRFDLKPSVLAYTVLIEVIESLIIISTRK